MATSTEQALLDAQIFGDPQGFIAPALSQLMPAHPGSVGPYLNVGVFPDPQTATQQAPWGGAQERGNIGPYLNPMLEIQDSAYPAQAIISNLGVDPQITGSDLQRNIDMTDLLYASGILNAEDSGWKSNVDVTEGLRAADHDMSSDTYGQQLGVKAALRREDNPIWSGGFTNLGHRARAVIDPVHQQLLPSKLENTKRAIDTYNAAQQGDLSAADSYEEQISRAISTALADSIPIANMPGAYQVAQADSLINRAISDKPAGGLGSDDPHDMYNIRTQYAPGDIRYVGDQALLPNESVIPIDNTNQYTIPQTLPVNPLSQLMTTGALLGNALPGFKEDISSGLEEFAPQGWQLNLPPVLRKGVDKIKDLFTEYDPTLDAELTYQYDPRELGLDPFTRERVAESSNFLANLMAEGTEAQKTAIQRAISPGTAPYLRESLAAHFERDDADSPFITDPSTGEPIQLASRAPANLANILRTPEPEPTWFPPTTSSGSAMVTDPTPTVEPSPFIGDEGFIPSLGGYTIAPSGPVVGEAEQPIAQAVAQALANTDQPVQQNLQALAALAQTDPSIADRYVPGSQALQDITSQVESFSEPRVEWTPPAPVVPDITEELVDFSAIQSSREAEAQKAQDKIDRQLEHAANVRRKDEKKARLAEARDKKAEAKKIAAEDKARKAEEKRISDKQAADEKQRRATEKQMADMLKQMNETHQAYLARKREEEARRKRLGYGVGAMWT